MLNGTLIMNVFRFSYFNSLTRNTDCQNLRPQPPKEYEEALAKLKAAKDNEAYENIWKETGLSKPSILSGLHPNLMLPIPKCFGLDLMHLLCLNMEDLLLCLWRGTMKCESTDDMAAWPWVKLVRETWIEHGKNIENTTQYFPSDFHCPPRNPAEKLSSGYKATEYYLDVFGLGPTSAKPG
ncbi:hypothetical protein BT96DRAFT_942217 [Gymnopus androsaceus JB14]|uniref:Uncharacterized protein n=1 Tax=Gymnopus androsaceus JB14 TaxID=1447944 RepID=A0A6A4HF19_9AGAR|nr:hypothetical protein BT96DRAFT_942217 [Gymnopus androsaceus JB14]